MPATAKLRKGDGLIETQGLVHHGSNQGKRPVVIEIAAVLQAGAPLSTPVGQSATGTPLEITADLDRVAHPPHRRCRRLGDLRLEPAVGTATVDGEPVGVELLGNVSYVRGSGPTSAA